MTAKSQHNDPRPRIAFFAGTFNPFTVGHASIVERALSVFDKVVIGVGINSLKTTSVEAERRALVISRLYSCNPAVSVMTYDCLTTDAARRAVDNWINSPCHFETIIDPRCDCIGVGVTQHDGITYCYMFVGIPNSVNFYA